MRRRRSGAAGLFIGVMLVVSAGAPAAGQSDDSGGEVQSGEFTTLTYNVAGLPEMLSGSDPAVNTPLISPLLNAYDLVLVQESWANPDPPVDVVRTYHEVLVSEVTHPYLSEPAPSPWHLAPEERQRDTALVADGLNRMSRFPFSELTRRMWTNCHGGGPGQELGAADCLSEKGFSVARTVVAPGVEIDVYNLHAEAGSQPEAVQYRQENLIQLAAFMEEYSAGRAVIIGGDFNVRQARDTGVYDSFLQSTGLTDVCQALGCAEDDELDRFAFRNGGGVTLEALSHSFERDRFRRDDGEPLSDHDALAVTFRWYGPVVDGPGPDPTTTTPDTTAPTTTPSSDPSSPTDPVTPGDDRNLVTPPAPAVTGSPRLTG